MLSAGQLMRVRGFGLATTPFGPKHRCDLGAVLAH